MPRNSNDLSQKEHAHPSLKRRLLVYLFNLFLICVIVVAGYVALIYLQMPSLDSVLHETRPAAVMFMDRHGNEIRASNRIMGTPVSVETLPPYVWQSIIAIEDKRFYDHSGVDFKRTSGAIMNFTKGSKLLNLNIFYTCFFF